MILRELLRQGAHLLAQTGSDEADLEAELLLAHALGLDRVHLYQRLPAEVTPQQEQAFRALLDRRLAHEPAAYILGHREFYGFELGVTAAAIIPRPETEVLVELVVEFARRTKAAEPFTLADIGVGAGAIAIAVARELPNAHVIATDSSQEALDLARRNAARHGLRDHIDFRRGDLLEPLDGPVDVIAANLPYVATPAWEQLPPEIRDHEPRAGLDGGPDGLRLIERLLRQAPAYLKPGGALFVEIGDDHGPPASTLARDCLPTARVEVKPDLQGLDRVLVVQT